MTGAGVGMFLLGGVVIVGTALLREWGSTAKFDAAYATGGGLFAGGATLIIVGERRRSAQ